MVDLLKAHRLFILQGNILFSREFSLGLANEMNLADFCNPHTYKQTNKNDIFFYLFGYSLQNESYHIYKAKGKFLCKVKYPLQSEQPLCLQ